MLFVSLTWFFRSSVVYGVMFGFFSFLIGLVRTYRPGLIIMTLFGQVVLDIFCVSCEIRTMYIRSPPSQSYGPLFPVPQYNLASSLLISVSTYMAIALVCIVFIFPETMNHEYLTDITDVMRQLKDYVNFQDRILSSAPDEIIEDEGKVVSKAVGARAMLLAAVNACKSVSVSVLTLNELFAVSAKSALINAEFSYGRWNGNDAKALEIPLKDAVARICTCGFRLV